MHTKILVYPSESEWGTMQLQDVERDPLSLGKLNNKMYVCPTEDRLCISISAPVVGSPRYLCHTMIGACLPCLQVKLPRHVESR
jgi:hypothetical protein